MSRFNSYPRHLKPPSGGGLITCSRSGFVRKPEDIVWIDGRPVAKDKADFYGGFGTDHPQDHAQPEIGGDPTPVVNGGLEEGKSKQDLNISDGEILAALRENRAPRSGY